MNNKVRNTHKRFRQGRATYKQLKTAFNGELAKNMKDAQELASAAEHAKHLLEEQTNPEKHDEVEHVHGESCNHG